MTIRVLFVLLGSGLLQGTLMIVEFCLLLCVTNLLRMVLAAVAQTSLFIPGFDPQPISASVAGVGPDGRTTWVLQPGVKSGSFDDIGFVGTG